MPDTRLGTSPLRRDWEVTDGVTSGDLFDELPVPFGWTVCATE
jgi:hypothetical protein